MQSRPIIIPLMLLMFATIACTLASSAPPTPISPNTAPTATVPPLVPSIGPATATPPPLIGVTPGTITPTITTTVTATLTGTVEATVAPTIAPVSTSPLDFQVSLIGCRTDATRSGGVILTFKVDATGGNGIYTYVREGTQVPQVSDRPATKGTAVIDAWRVRSGDGQQLEKKFRFTGADFHCP